MGVARLQRGTFRWIFPKPNVQAHMNQLGRQRIWPTVRLTTPCLPACRNRPNTQGLGSCRRAREDARPSTDKGTHSGESN